LGTTGKKRKQLCRRINTEEKAGVGSCARRLDEWSAYGGKKSLEKKYWAIKKRRRGRVSRRG